MGSHGSVPHRIAGLEHLLDHVARASDAVWIARRSALLVTSAAM